jgi:hypothetical protein
MRWEDQCRELRVPDLKAVLKDVGLVRSGRKAELHQRLLAAVAQSQALADSPLYGHQSRTAAKTTIDKIIAAVDRAWRTLRGYPSAGAAAGGEEHQGGGGGNNPNVHRFLEMAQNGSWGQQIGGSGWGRQQQQQQAAPARPREFTSPADLCSVDSAKNSVGAPIALQGAPGAGPMNGAAAAMVPAAADPSIRCLCGHQYSTWDCTGAVPAQPPRPENTRHLSMVQCERCLTWQHAACYGLTDSTLPTGDHQQWFCLLCVLQHLGRYDF